MGDLASTRVFGHGHGGGGVVTVGLRRRPLRDLYHWLVSGSWTRVIIVFALAYFGSQGLLSAARLALTHARPAEGPFVASLLAAIQAPPVEPPLPLSARGLALGLVAALDGFVHWVELVIGAGIVLAKFSLVRARVLFSNVAVIAPYEGGRTAFMFRMANERTSHMVDAKIAVILVRNEVVGGEVTRRAHDLDLVRGGTALFSHAWTAVHPIGRESPLWGETAASLEASEAELIVNLSGFDEQLLRTMNARHVYPAGRIRWNARFRDIVKLLPNGQHQVDYRKFHHVVPVDDPAAAVERTPARRAR